LGEWAVENGMKINPGKSKTIIFTIAQVKNPLGYSLRCPKNSGSEQLYIMGNNLMKRFKMGGPSKLHGAKSLEDTSLCKACSYKRK
jgi:hypothetical protein